MTAPTEAEDAAAHVAHYAHHVTRCDQATKLLADATQALTAAARLLDEVGEDNWGGDGELDYTDHTDASRHYSAALAHIRDMGRIIAQLRADAEHQRHLNAENAKCSKCGFSGAVAERFDAETDRVVWLCWTCRHNATA